jgi:hypothetical protein
MSRAGDRGSAAGPAMGDVRTAGAADDAAAAVAAPGVPRLEYQETAVGRLPVGPAADAALAAAAITSAGRAGRPAPERRPADVVDVGAASRGAVLKRLVAALAGALAAAVAMVLWRRTSS